MNWLLEPLAARDWLLLSLTVFWTVFLIVMTIKTRKNKPKPPVVLSELGAKIVAYMNNANVYDCVCKSSSGLFFDGSKLVVHQREESYTDPVNCIKYSGKVFLEDRSLDSTLTAVDHAAIQEALAAKLVAVCVHRDRVNADYARKKLG